jgi:predicted HicB family RNase H-like nuclease
MDYKSYVAAFTYDEMLELFQGKVSNVSTLIIFQGRSIETLRFSFQNAIDEYVAWCKKTARILKNLLLSFPEILFNMKGIYVDLW